MPSLQDALASLGGALKVKRAVVTSAVKQSRVVPFGTFAVPLRPLVEPVDPIDRAPPEHEPNFSERYFHA